MKILIRLPNWLGDVVMSTAFIRAVQQLYPGSQVDVIVKKELSDIPGFIPGIHKIHSFSKQEYKGLIGVYRFGKQLRSEQYDLFFCLPDSLSSAVMGWASRAKKRIGYGKEGRFFLLTNSYAKSVKQHRVDEYLGLLEKFTCNAIHDRKVEITVAHKESYDNKFIIVNFNSEAESRRMPADKTKHLLNVLYNAFPDYQFGLFGSPKEKEFIDSLVGDRDDKRIINYAGKTKLGQLAGYMALSKAVITTDSGPAHLANALSLPTIVLFGAGDETNTAPYNKEHLTVLRAGKLECEPCVRNTCKLYGIPKCMELLDEMKIVNALSLYLNHA